MERELKVPYSTVRGRLDEVIRELGFEAEPGQSEQDNDGYENRRKEILLHLEEGSIEADAAIAELESLKRRKGIRES
jgi:hypothetical protein